MDKSVDERKKAGLVSKDLSVKVLLEAEDRKVAEGDSVYLNFDKNPLEGGVWKGVGLGTRFAWSSSGGFDDRPVVVIDKVSSDERVRLETVEGIQVQPGERYRVKGWIRHEVDCTGVACIGVKWTSGENVLGEQLSPGVWNAEWTLSEMVVTVPKNADKMYVQCRSDGITGRASFDGVIIEKLDKSGVWTSATVGGNQKQFSPDDTPTMSVVLENPASYRRDIQVEVHVEDYADREVYAVTKEVQLDGNGKREIDISLDVFRDKQGYFNVYVYTVESGEILGQLRDEFIVFPENNVAGSQWLLDNPVAVNIYVWSEAQFYGTSEEEIRAYVRKLRQMGVQTLRFWIRIGYEKWIPHHLDVMKIAKEHGMEVLLVVGFMLPASENAHEVAEEEGFGRYFKFLEEVLPEYSGLVDVVEVWNEPFPTPFFFEVLRGGYNRVKAFDPNLRVIHAGFYNWHTGVAKNPDKEKLEYFSNGTAFNDLASLNHYYTEGYNHHEYYPEAPEVPYMQDLTTYRGIINKYGVGSYGESLWQTETSWESAVQKPYKGYHGHPEMRMFTYRQQADYAVRLLLMARSESYRDLDIRNFWYFVHDMQEFRYVPWYRTGLLERSGQPKPSYLMVVNMVNTLANSKHVGRLELSGKESCDRMELDEDIWGLVFRNGKEPILAIWSAKGEKDVDLNVWSSKVVVVDPMGNKEEVEVADNILSLTISESPIYILGGGEELLWEGFCSQLKRVNMEGMDLLKGNADLHGKFSEIAKFSEAVFQDRDAEQFDTAAERVYGFVNDLLKLVQSGQIDVRDAFVYMNTLRTADILEEATMLAHTVEDVEGLRRSLEDVYLQHKALEKRLDPFVGTSKAKTLMRFSERRLALAKRDMELNRWDDVSVLLRQIKRLHTIVDSVLEVETRYRLDVWMKSDTYFIQAGIGESNTVNVAVSNESNQHVVAKLSLHVPAGVSVKVERTEMALPPGSAVEVPLVITVEQGFSGTREIRVTANVDKQPLAPVAIGVQHN